MDLWKLYVVSFMSILKLLLTTALGAFLANDRFNILRENARKHLNAMVYFVFTPALIYSSMSNTLTLRSMTMLWFMPLSILVTYIAGTILGWLLIITIRVPRHLHGLVLGCCAAGNLASLPLIVVPNICKEKNNPFGDEAVCHRNGLAYASLSMAVGYTYTWSITFNIVRIYSSKISNEVKVDESTVTPKSATENDPENLLKCPCGELVMAEDTAKPNNGGKDQPDFECKVPNGQEKVPERLKIMKQLKILADKINNMKILIAPSTIAAIIGLTIGVVPQFRKLLVGDNALLHVVQDTITMLGDASVPAMVLLLGANLVNGLKGIGQQLPLIVGIIIVKFVALPAIGIGIVKGAAHFNLIHHDPLYQFVLLLQYALPPAIVVSTITQMFGVGEGECSAIMLATYCCSAILLTLWCTMFMWLPVAFVVMIIHKMQNIMGVLRRSYMGLMGGKGLIRVEFAPKAMTKITRTLYNRFIEKKQIENFNDFHTAFLDIFKNFMKYGIHARIIKIKKETFTNFTNENVSLSHAQFMMIIGTVAPPIVMVAKRIAESVPVLSVIETIPDVAFVTTTTLLVLVAVKLTKITQNAFETLCTMQTLVLNSYID